MKKFYVIVSFVFLLQGTAFAQDKTLYAITRDTFSLVEAYTACAGPGAACTEDEALAMQAAAKSSLADLKQLIASGDTQRMLMTVDEARAATGLAAAVQERFMHIQLFDAPCNQAHIFLVEIISFAVRTLGAIALVVLYVASFSGPVVQALAVLLLLVVEIPLAIIFLPIILSSFVLLAPCLFWWL
jgi:hypothetical protein